MAVVGASATCGTFGHALLRQTLGQSLMGWRARLLGLAVCTRAEAARIYALAIGAIAARQIAKRLAMAYVMTGRFGAFATNHPVRYIHRAIRVSLA